MKEPRVQLILSFDHELSLGGARCYQTNLFEPTEKLFALARELDVPVALFTDICCAMRFRQWDPEGFYQPYCEQIDQGVRLGHDMQLHLHPHWFETRYDNQRFHPSGKYRLGDFDSPDGLNLESIIARGVEELSALCQPGDPAYQCIAYRGGGYNMEPHTDRILHALAANGITLESSICRDMRFRSQNNTVDYRNMPEQANWIIPLDGPLNAMASEGLFEIPVVCSPRTPLNNLPFLVKRVIHRKRQYASTGTGLIEGQSSRWDRLRRLAPNSVWQLGFDSHTDSADTCLSMLKRYVNRHAGPDPVICSAVSHPKAMGPYQRELMRVFIDKARAHYGEQLGFTTYADIHRQLMPASAPQRAMAEI